MTKLNPPLIEQGVTQADINAFGERCYMAGYRAAWAEIAKETHDLLDRTRDYVTEIVGRGSRRGRLRKFPPARRRLP